MEKDDITDRESLRKYYDSISRIKLLTPDEERDLAIAKGRGEKDAIDSLVRANLRLVIKIAKNYLSFEPSLIDLVQEGNLGLIRAAEKYDYRIGCKFSTYASYWIKHYITRFIAKRSRAIRIPIRKNDLFKKIRQAKDYLQNELERDPSIREIAALLNIDEHDVSEILDVFQPTVSLEYPLNDGEFNLMELLSDEKNSEPDQAINRNDLRNELEVAMNSLMENERKILKLRFGFDDDRPITLKDVGNEFGISAETVRQIEVRAMDKLRKRYGFLEDYIE